jgi:hypothetical protein
VSAADMAGFPERFDFHLIVWPEDDPTHPFPDKLLQTKHLHTRNV